MPFVYRGLLYCLGVSTITEKIHCNNNYGVIFLQLRVQSDQSTAQLISYNRKDTAGPKLSDYHVATIQVILNGGREREREHVSI